MNRRLHLPHPCSALIMASSKAPGVMRSGIRTTDRRSLEIALEENDSSWKADDSERTVARTWAHLVERADDPRRAERHGHWHL